MFQGGECLSLGHLLRTWPPAISVKTTLRFSHRSETSVCTYSVVQIHSRTQSPSYARSTLVAVGCPRVRRALGTRMVQIRIDQCGVYSCRTFITSLIMHLKTKIALEITTKLACVYSFSLLSNVVLRKIMSYLCKS
jgi:hypothetical protein